MVSETHRTAIQRYLDEAKLMQLATSQNDQPWVCSVWFAPDADFNLYWLSSEGRRHSGEINGNPNVAATIVKPHHPLDPPSALHFEGTAELVVDQPDIELAQSLYTDRIWPQERVLAALNHPERPHRFYRLRPRSIVTFNAMANPQKTTLTIA